MNASSALTATNTIPQQGSTVLVVQLPINTSLKATHELQETPLGGQNTNFDHSQIFQYTFEVINNLDRAS